MLRPAAQALLRSRPLRNAVPRLPAQATRRYASTSAADKPRSWRSGLIRWGLAGAAVYYYNTSSIFAEEPAYPYLVPDSQNDTEPLQTLDSIAAEKRRERLATGIATESSVVDTSTVGSLGEGAAVAGSPEELEQEADQQGAFNPDTGEINWDCPCLGGMAHGPCGEEFKAAFSCFVYSTEDPKGMDCIEKFRGMQDCFRKYPDVYGAELEDEEEDAEAGEAHDQSVSPSKDIQRQEAEETSSIQDADSREEKYSDNGLVQESGLDVGKAAERMATQQAKSQIEPLSENGDVVPKAWHDTRGAEPRAK